MFRQDTIRLLQQEVGPFKEVQGYPSLGCELR